jgi:hypothetical protein
MARILLSYGFSVGESFLWHALSFGALIMEMSG